MKQDHGFCTDPAEHQAHSPPGERNPHSRTGKNSSAEKPLRVWEAEGDNSALCPRGRGGQPHPACSPNTVTRSPRQVISPFLLAAVRLTLKPFCTQVWAPQIYTLTYQTYHLQVCGEPAPQLRVCGTERQLGLLSLRKTRTNCCL